MIFDLVHNRDIYDVNITDGSIWTKNNLMKLHRLG